MSGTRKGSSHVSAEVDVAPRWRNRTRGTPGPRTESGSRRAELAPPIQRGPALAQRMEGDSGTMTLGGHVAAERRASPTVAVSASWECVSG